MMQDKSEDIKEIPTLLVKLYEIVRELESRFGRKFTPDGHLVGSIGEVVAAYLYDLTLLPASEHIHDAKATDGRMVQIKATQGKSVALREKPDHLIVLRIGRDGKSTEVYNGPGELAWQKCGPRQPNGQKAIGITRLTQLMETVKQQDRLNAVRSWPTQ